MTDDWLDRIDFSAVDPARREVVRSAIASLLPPEMTARVADALRTGADPRLVVGEPLGDDAGRFRGFVPYTLAGEGVALIKHRPLPQPKDGD